MAKVELARQVSAHIAVVIVGRLDKAALATPRDAAAGGRMGHCILAVGGDRVEKGRDVDLEPPR